MNCIFCQIYIGDPRTESTQLRCTRCDAQFVYSIGKDGPQLVYYQFTEEEYRFRFWLFTDTNPAFELEHKFQSILRLHTIPKITPHNKKEKLPTLLTFL